MSINDQLTMEHGGHSYEVEVQSITDITEEQRSFDVQEGYRMVNIVVDVENTGSEIMFIDIDFYDDISLDHPDTNNNISDPYVIDEEEDITPNVVEIRDEELAPNEQTTIEFPLVIREEMESYHFNFHGELLRFSKEDIDTT